MTKMEMFGDSSLIDEIKSKVDAKFGDNEIWFNLYNEKDELRVSGVLEAPVRFDQVTTVLNVVGSNGVVLFRTIEGETPSVTINIDDGEEVGLDLNFSEGRLSLYSNQLDMELSVIANDEATLTDMKVTGFVERIQERKVSVCDTPSDLARMASMHLDMAAFLSEKSIPPQDRPTIKSTTLDELALTEAEYKAVDNLTRMGKLSGVSTQDAREAILGRRLVSKRNVDIPEMYKRKTSALEILEQVGPSILLTKLSNAEIGSVRDFKQFSDWAGDLDEDYKVVMVRKSGYNEYPVNGITAYVGSEPMVSVNTNATHPIVILDSKELFIVQEDKVWYVANKKHERIFMFLPR